MTSGNHCKTRPSHPYDSQLAERSLSNRLDRALRHAAAIYYKLTLRRLYKQYTIDSIQVLSSVIINSFFHIGFFLKLFSDI